MRYWIKVKFLETSELLTEIVEVLRIINKIKQQSLPVLCMILHTENKTIKAFLLQ